MADVFIYCPRSGDRVFIEREHPEITLLRWRNGCRHAVGGIHLRVRSAGSVAGRDLATRLVTEVVLTHGGVGWDDRGDVQCVVPRYGALALEQAAGELRTHASHQAGVSELAPLAPQLFGAGLSYVDRDGNFAVTDPGPGPEAKIQSVDWWDAPERGRRLRVVTSLGGVAVPERWAEEATVWGRPLTLPPRPPADGPAEDLLDQVLAEDS